MEKICFICIKNPKNIETLYILNNNVIETFKINPINIKHLQKYLLNKICISFGYSINILASYNIKAEFINLKNMYRINLNLSPGQKINRWQMVNNLDINIDLLTNKNNYENGKITCNIYKLIYDKLILL